MPPEDAVYRAPTYPLGVFPGNSLYEALEHTALAAVVAARVGADFAIRHAVMAPLPGRAGSPTLAPNHPATTIGRAGGVASPRAEPWPSVANEWAARATVGGGWRGVRHDAGAAPAVTDMEVHRWT